MDENTKYAMDIIDANHQRQITRLWIALAITGLLFVATNIFWIYREFQYEDVVTETYTTTSDGDKSIFVNGTGELYINGTDDIQKNDKESEENAQ